MTSLEISLVLASQDPKKLAEFYAFVINGEVHLGFNNKNYRVLSQNGLIIETYLPSQQKPLPSKGKASSYCFKGLPSKNPLIKIKEWCSELINQGAIVVENPVIESFGAEAWMADPEGNHFLILIPMQQDCQI